MEFIKNILLFVILLSTIVSLHELGHLIAAKIFNVYCQEYSIGMGPKLFSIKGKETEYSLRALPLGGFVAMAGDTDNTLETSVDTANIPFERTLPGIAKWKRAIVMLAGIMMNMILAITIYSLVILSAGRYTVSTKPLIAEVVAQSPAEQAGLKQGDLVTSIGFDNGLIIEPSTYTELISFAGAYEGEGPWTMEISRDGESKVVKVYPRFDEAEQRYMIGVAFSNGADKTVKVNLLNCWFYGIQYAFFIVKLTWSSFLSLFRGMDLSSLSGPVGIYSTVSQAASLGFEYYVQLIAMISINVGIFNALPLPVFDGGRVVLLLVEMIMGRPLNKKIENFVMSASVLLLLLLMLFVTYNDVFKLIGGQ